MDQDATWYGGRPWPRRHCGRLARSPPEKRVTAPIFGQCLLRPNGCMHQGTTWYGGRPQPRQHCVRWGSSSPSQFSAYVRCGQTAGWTKMPLGMEVGIGPAEIGFQLPPQTGHSPQFPAHVYCSQTAGWMGTLLGTKVDLAGGQNTLCYTGTQLPHEKGTADPPPFLLAHVHCGHDRQSQLLLGSCLSLSSSSSSSLFILPAGRTRNHNCKTKCQTQNTYDTTI